MWNTRAYTSFKISVINAAPYIVGLHFGLGDRVAAEIGRRRKRLYVDQVHSLKYRYSHTEDPTFDIGIGNDEADQPPTSRLARMWEKSKAVMQMFSVDV